MKKTTLIFSLSALFLAGVSGQALAQAAAAPAAAPTPPAPPTFGAAIPGQCVLDEQTAMTDSAMGKAAAQRLVQLKAVVDSELSTQGKSLDDERQALVTQQKTATTPALKTALETKAQAWEQKREAFQEKVDQRNKEMQYTQQEVMSAIFQKMIPQINAVVTQKGCATVISADSLLHYDMTTNTNGQPTQTSFLYANPSMNITSDVVAKLDATKELLPQFDRVSLDQPAQGAAPAQK
ncbi:OmpH family outer membrane protein [Asticcacaulis sp. EMRT-3]|uniref:OmpH family outer membrane protein n=1 Tax=Asticcacaulis sp. EMRT-3 TaxID=3040349 RepID=UPI0024AE9160|nr:OmpH family outer membrane protein [Asticcacaulis sp. EMRT-3]MDI7774840.1 OmpH family outer membrane protein [Asticcacaulis sp. EMRT-3]